MSTSRRQSHDASLPAPADLAPHVEPAWADAFVLELRLRGVSGAAIGAALAEVDSHCAESGEPAVGAFGDPVAYARELGLPVEAHQRAGLVRALGPTALQLAGLLLTTWAALPWRRGESLELTAGHLASAVALAVAVTALVVGADPVLRFVVERTAAAAVVAAVWVGGTVALLVLLDDALLVVPAGPVLIVGALVLAAGVLVQLRQQSGEDPLADPLVSPAPTVVVPPASPGRRAATFGATWMVPLTAVVLVGVSLLLG